MEPIVIKEPLHKRAKNFVLRHKTKFLASGLVLTGAAAVAARASVKDHDDFLLEKDLYDEFHNPSDHEE